VPELLPQCPAWGCTRGGGRLQLTVAGMAPRRPIVTTWPCKVTGKHSEGAAGPPSRARHVSRTGVGGAASRGCHRPRRTVSQSGGDGFPPRKLVQQDRGVSPRRMMAPPRRCQSIKCTYPRAGAGVRVRNALEPGGARSREACTLERGGTCSKEACTLERGGACSKGPLSGPPRWAAGATAAWAAPCVRA
jgi:hypothetical protein